MSKLSLRRLGGLWSRSSCGRDDDAEVKQCLQAHDHGLSCWDCHDLARMKVEPAVLKEELESQQMEELSAPKMSMGARQCIASVGAKYRDHMEVVCSF